MDEHRRVEGGRGEDGSVLGMGPGELVDGSGVAGEGGVDVVGVVGDIVDFDGAICEGCSICVRVIVRFACVILIGQKDIQKNNG